MKFELKWAKSWYNRPLSRRNFTVDSRETPCYNNDRKG